MRIPHYLGTLDGGGKLELPDDAVTEGFGAFGQRGAGKSNFLAVVCEILAKRKHPFVILDPPDAHWGIRFEAGADGQPCGPSGLDVLIVGGEHGDVPLNPEKGKELAHIIVDGDISAVICLKSLGYTQQQRFCTEFGSELFRINRTPRMIAFEECHNFLPQNLKFEAQKEVLYTMDKFISEGRGTGLGFILASQRLSKVNKDAVEEVQNLFAMRMMGANDLKQLEGWFKYHVRRDENRLNAILDDTAQLEAGECWFLSPVWLKQFVKFKVRQRVTYHSGRTPKPGERRVSVAKFTVTEAVEKLKKLFSQKSVAIQSEVADLNQAKKKIRELEAQLRSRPSVPEQVTVADPKAIERAVRPLRTLLEETMRVFVKVSALGFEDAAIKPEEVTKALEATAREISRLAKQGLLQRASEFDRLKREMNSLMQRVNDLLKQENLTVNVKVAHNEPFSVQPAPPRPVVHRAVADGDTKLRPGAKRMLEAAAMYYPNGVTEGQMAAQAGVKRSGGSFSSYKSNLKTNGFLLERSGLFYATESGMAHLGETPSSPQSTREVLDVWIPKLRPGAQRMLAVLVEEGGNALSYEDLSARSGINSEGGSFSSYLSNLRTAGLAVDAGRRMAAANKEVLFL